MKPSHKPRRAAAGAATAIAALLSGCATLSPEQALEPVAAGVRQHSGATLAWNRSAADDAEIAERVRALLAAPLTADAAVQLALANHRGLQAKLAELGIARAELLQAGRLPNPGFSWLRTSAGGEIAIERALHLNLARLLLWPQQQALARQRLAEVQGEALAQALALAADVRRAWISAVASAQLQRYAEQVMKAAEASAELARRMAQVGNFNALSQAREQAFYADAALGRARAQQAGIAARERLIRLLGLWGEQTAFALPERLPELPAAARERPNIEREAIALRLDLQGAKQRAERLAAEAGLTRATRFVNVLELGLERESEPHGERSRGVELSFELPLFDSGDARIARAEAVYAQAVHRVAEVAINARSEVREAYAAYRGAHDIARHHRDEIVPLRARIAEENLLRYNGMLIGVFELLADARAQIASVAAAIEAERDYWLAETDLDAALLGKPALPAPSSSATAAPQAGGGDPH